MENNPLYDYARSHATQKIFQNGRIVITDKLIGEGNFAKTFLGYDTCMQRAFACKVINKATVDTKILKHHNPKEAQKYYFKNLKREVDVLKTKPDHENIVKFYQYIESKSNIYIFMQYCFSGIMNPNRHDCQTCSDLSAAITTEITLPEKIKFCLDIAKGLAYLDEQEIYHRDLKPENVLIHYRTAKIADFGHSKSVQNKEKYKPQQQTFNVGTPYYCALQILEDKQYSIKCDVWSFGVTIYRMFYGCTPWGQSCKDVPTLIKKGKGEIHFLQIGVPPLVNDLIRKCIVYEEEHRLNAKEVRVLAQNIFDLYCGSLMTE